MDTAGSLQTATEMASLADQFLVTGGNSRCSFTKEEKLLCLFAAMLKKPFYFKNGASQLYGFYRHTMSNRYLISRCTKRE